jgi:uncharacterized Fe-S cluster protein YjdI/CDGSH-type Zn-finger protein
MTEPDERGKRYTAPEITVQYDIRKCIHAGICVRSLPAVFDTAERPWIRPDRAPAEAVADVVRRCPTGALQYTLTNGPAEQPDARVTISPQTDGPLFIRGDLMIERGDGAVAMTRAALCRCGHSANKPFCDGTHARIGWRSDVSDPSGHRDL